MAVHESDYAIEFRDVSRRFVLHHERRASFQDWFIGLIRPRGIAEEFWALRNVSFGIRRGETIGIIGRNGAGKSTLLKLVTRILEPSHGRVIVNGRTYAMLELGSGFHPELSGRDNIYLNGSLYGFSRKQMNERYADIVRFAELERFVDTPVKHYSSGMYARLGFGIAVNMNPEILVIDEVLAVGDATFQEKCFSALEELKKRGTTIIFVSHDADSVRRFCDRAALLAKGLLEDIGPANEVVDHYERQLTEGLVQARLLRVRSVDTAGAPLDFIRTGDDVSVEVLLRVPEHASTEGLGLRIDLFADDNTHLFSATTELPSTLPAAQHASQRSSDEPDTRAASIVLRSLPLAHGTLHLIATLNEDPLNAAVAIDRQETLLRVEPTTVGQKGMLAIDHNWTWDNATETEQAPAVTTLSPDS